MKLYVDGGRARGYRLDCECGFSWSSGPQAADSLNRTAALPIGCAVVHMRLSHPDQFPNLQFSRDYSAELAKVWNTAYALTGVGTETMTR